MKRASHFLIAFCLYSISLKADYRPLRLYQMIYESDRIAVGFIEKLDSQYFYFRDTVSQERSLLKIKRFADWACASRYGKYKIGQKAILFLKAEKNNYTVMSAGNEGELHIVKDSVNLAYKYFSFLDTWRNESGQIIKDSLARYLFISGFDFSLKAKVSVSELIASIDKLKSAYNWSKQNSLGCSEWISRNICNNQKLFNDPGFTGFLFKGLAGDKLRAFKNEYDEFGNKLKKDYCNQYCH